jgi:flagellin-specific chaperone FliS
MTKEQIENEFRNLTGINEAKKVFKKLAQVLHPDKGGSNEEFQELNSVYNYYLENKLYFSNESKFDLELEKIISKILHYEDITIEVVGSWIWVSGNTKHIKDDLKDLSFRYAHKKGMWYYGEKVRNGGKTKSMEEIKAKYGCETIIKTKEKGRLTV